MPKRIILNEKHVCITEDKARIGANKYNITIQRFQGFTYQEARDLKQQIIKDYDSATGDF